MSTVYQKLQQRDWWIKTATQVKTQVLDLAKEENKNLFLNDLANLPDKLGSLSILSLKELVITAFMVIPIFNVEKNGKQYTYQFCAWRKGSNSGAKGVIFIKNQTGKIDHLLILHSYRFALGSLVYDCPGGFSLDSDKDVRETLKREIKEEVGLLNSEMEIIPLGKIYPDAGMTNNHPDLFAAIIDNFPQKVMGTAEPEQADPQDMDSRVAIYPLTSWKLLVKDNDDSFFLAIMLRALAQNIIQLD